MNTSIHNQLLQCYSRNFTTNWIKCRQYDCLWCIVND